MIKYSFSYEVILFDGKTYYSESGMSFADNFSEATSILQDFYKANLMIIQHLELFEKTPVIILPRDVVKNVEVLDENSFAIPCDARGNLIEEAANENQ